MKIIFVILLSCFSFIIKSQSLISGIVKDNTTKEPIPGVTLYFPDLKSGTTTNSDGFFEFKKLPNVKLLLQIRSLGYKTIVQQIEVNSKLQLEFFLEESIVEAEEVVVTGVSHATESKRNPLPMIAIDQKYLQHNSGTNAIDVLNKIPGVNSLSSGPNISKPMIRGLGQSRILTLYDGLRQEGQQWGEEHGIEVDQFSVNRVEVIKGPASLIYGSDALAGVINLLPENTAAEGTINGTLSSNYQSNNDLIANSINLTGNKKGFVWGSRSSYKIAANYKNAIDGKVYNTGFIEKNFSAYIGLNRHWGYSHLNFSIFDNLQEIPDGYRDSSSRKFVKQISEIDTLRQIVSDEELNSYNISVIHQHIKHLRVFSTNNFYLGQSKITSKFGYQQSIRKEFAHPEFATIPGLYLLMHTITYDLKFHFPTYKGFDNVIGINGMSQINQANQGTNFVIPNYQLFDFAPFFFCKKNYLKWDFAGGIRYDTRVFKNERMYTKINSTTNLDYTVNGNDTLGAYLRFKDYNNLFKGWSGSFGIAYNLSKNIIIKGNIARGYRAPSISEIAAKGIHPGSGFLQLGDENFLPEFNYQTDLGLFYEGEHITASVELFNNLLDNYIFNQKLLGHNNLDSLFEQNGNYYPIYKFKQTKAQLYGGELSIDIHPHPFDWLHIENSLSLVNANNLGTNGVVINSNNRYLPFIPPLHTNSEIRGEATKNIYSFSGLYAKIDIQYYAAQNRVYLAEQTETITPSYSLLDFGVGAHLNSKNGKRSMSLNIFINNITDVSYQSNMSRLKYLDNYPNNHTGKSGVYNMGRNVSVKIAINF